MDNQEFERDEQLLEARRLKRLEQKRRYRMQQRLVLGVLLIIIVLVIVLVARGCKNSASAPQEDPIDTPKVQTPVEPEIETEPDTTITIAAVGDIMMYDDQIADALQENGSYDFTENFAAVSGYTVSADLTVGNLELNFCGEPYGGKPDYRAPESLTDTLKAVGFDILQTANTYSIQNGLSGLQSTLKFLNTAGLDHVGTYAAADDKSTNEGVLLKTVNGIKIAFIAYTKGLNGLSLPDGSEYAVDLLYKDYATEYSKINTEAIEASIQAAKSLNPDIIIAMLHWGSDPDITVTETQKEITTLMFENGVDAIVGSHSHIVGPMEEHQVTTVDGEEKTCFVAYSLGNFFSSMDESYTKYCRESVVLNLSFTKNGKTGDTSISNISYTPLYLYDKGEDAETRFEILPIRSAIESKLFPDMEQAFTDAIARLRTNTQSDYDSGK